MKGSIIVIASFFAIISGNLFSQTKTTNVVKSNQNTKTLVTESMAKKISYSCYCYEGSMTIFFEANKDSLTASDLFEGKHRVILNSLYEHPTYAENFIYHIVSIYKDNFNVCLRDVFYFSEEEIRIAKKIYFMRKEKRDNGN